MKRFKVIDTFFHAFTVVTDAISRPWSLSFHTYEHLNIFSTIAKKITRMFVSFTAGTLRIQADGKMQKKSGNILLASTLNIHTQSSKLSKPSATIVFNYTNDFDLLAQKKLTMTQYLFLSILANGIATILRPFGGLDTDPNYNPDGIDNLTFQEIDEWEFLTCDRITTQ